jgi:hypothetical protein
VRFDPDNSDDFDAAGSEKDYWILGAICVLSSCATGAILFFAAHAFFTYAGGASW